MVTFLNSFFIAGEIPLTWHDAVPESPSPGLNPVFLSDATGLRSAIFVHCIRCNSLCGISPASAEEIRGWNQPSPEVSVVLTCPGCRGTFLITQEKANWLSPLVVS